MADMFIPTTRTPMDSVVAGKLLEAAGPDRVAEIRVCTWPSVGWSVPSDIYGAYLALINPPVSKRGKK